jgi:hypothetical protein
VRDDSHFSPASWPREMQRRGGAIVAPHESGSVKVFGCRPTKMTPRTPGPAYANLQRRKPREGIRQTVRRALSKMVSRVISIRSREFSKNLGFEYVYNFGVMARVLLTGESRFLSSCDFKELRVIKRARFTTLTLAASQHSFCSIARTEGLKKTSTRSN